MLKFCTPLKIQFEKFADFFENHTEESLKFTFKLNLSQLNFSRSYWGGSIELELSKT